MILRNKINRIFHSIIAKLIWLIIILALTIMSTLAVFKSYILANESRHQFFFLLFVVFLIFVLAIYFIHRLLMPINVLSKGIKEISNGNLDVNIVINSNDEFGKLAYAFNQMTKELKKMIQAKEQLLLDVSHELQTPLTRAKIALEMVDETEFISSAKKNLKEVEVMIKELLETQRLDNRYHSLKISEISIKDLLEYVKLEYQSSPPGLNIFPVTDSLSVEVDERLMKLVLRNIINNAYKYSSTSLTPVEIIVIDKNDKIIIQIEDSGPGINPEELDYIFEPFYRTDKARARNTGGYGLGLHLCKKIIEAHQGTIKINNKEHGTGLVVEISLNRKFRG